MNTQSMEEGLTPKGSEPASILGQRIETADEFLMEASQALSMTLDLQVIVRQIARLAVPKLSDWCIVRLFDECGKLMPMAVAHRDPDKQKIMEGRNSWETLDPMQVTILRRVLQTGEVETLNQLTPDLLVEHLPNAEHRALVEELGVTSYLCVPLILRDKTLGILSLMRIGQSYFLPEIQLAREAARRMALAIQNAKLYQNAKIASELRQKILVTVSHDLRNPLSNILANAALLEKSLDQGRRDSLQVRSASCIIKSAHQMLYLIQDLLNVERLEAGWIGLDLQSHSAIELVDGALETHRALAAERRVCLGRPSGLEDCRVLCDQERVSQILSNLIGNAIKFTPPDGSVEVCAKAQGEVACFSVTDTGRGISESELPFIFDRFWQARHSDHAGAGLGLSIVKELVGAQKGQVWVQSRLGEGSTFYFTLPLIRFPS